MIAGVGSDIVDLRRVRRMLSRFPRRMPRKLLTAAERREFAARDSSLSYLAGRVAAKEALAKALRTGLRAPFGWRRVSVLTAESGAPSFVFAPDLRAHLRARCVSACHVSISHDGDYAAAVVVAEGE